MNHTEKNDACTKAYKEFKVDELREVSIKAFNVAQEEKTKYLEARDNYHKIYREIWNS